MTQEEKELLLKDLCARAFYGVQAHYERHDFVGGSERFLYEADGTVMSVDISLGNPVYINFIHVQVEELKPYLRPMSSMTEEEKLEYVIAWDSRQPYLPTEAMDWLNAHHFDYRGLIEKGLALEAPEGMYKND